jgi:hypothetical protein
MASSPQLRRATCAAVVLLLAACTDGESPPPPADAAPRLELSATALSFSGVSYRDTPAPRTIEVRNAGGGSLSRPTLTVVGQHSGWLSGEVAPGTSAPYTLTLRPSTDALPAGTYTATVRVESPGAASSPQDVAVSLTLRPSWTILVYGHGDGDGSLSLARDLAAMSEAVLSEGVTAVVAADWSAGRIGPLGEAFPSGTERFRIVGSGAAPELIATLPEQDFDDPAVLSATAADAFYWQPSDRLGVVLWGRGASWLGGFGGDEHDTPADPGDDGAGLAPAQIAAALSDALTSIGRAGPLDLVAFDGSLMMGQEVAFELRDVARVYVATAELELGGGWDYAATFGRLASNPSLTAAELAVGEVQDWNALHASGTAGALGRAHAALDLGSMASYAQAWSAVSSAIGQSATLDWLELARIQYRVAPGYGVVAPGNERRAALRDAGQFLAALGGLTSDPAVAAAAVTAHDALAATVFASSLGSVRAGNAQAGVHFEAALGNAWPARMQPYSELAWHAATGWGDVLGGLAGNDDGTPPELQRTAQNTGDPTSQDPPRVLLGSPDADVGGASLAIARVGTGGQVLSFGVVDEADVLPDELLWSGNLPELTDGARRSAVFVQPWLRDPSGATFLVPGLLRDGATELEAYAIVVEGTPSVDALALHAGGRVTIVPVGDLSGLELVPLVRDELTGAWQRSTPLTIPPGPEAALTFEWTSAPAGLYRLVTTATDVWGNVAVETDDVTVQSPFGT